jgi:hypothetical protein
LAGEIIAKTPCAPGGLPPKKAERRNLFVFNALIKKNSKKKCCQSFQIPLLSFSIAPRAVPGQTISGLEVRECRT